MGLVWPQALQAHWSYVLTEHWAAVAHHTSCQPLVSPHVQRQCTARRPPVSAACAAQEPVSAALRSRCLSHPHVSCRGSRGGGDVYKKHGLGLTHLRASSNYSGKPIYFAPPCSLMAAADTLQAPHVPVAQCQQWQDAARQAKYEFSVHPIGSPSD